MKNAFDDVNNIGRFDYLIVCLDGDDEGVEIREQQVNNFIKENNLQLSSDCELKIIVQDKCIETWFLGNENIYSRQPESDELRAYTQYYNVQKLDPELMEKPEGFDTSAQFHEKYLKEILAAKKLSYTKQKPNEVLKEYYLKELISRIETTNHLQSFKVFYDFCIAIKE